MSKNRTDKGRAFPAVPVLCLTALVLLLVTALPIFVPIKGADGVYTIFSKSIDLSGSSVEDISPLRRCTAARSINLRDMGLTDVSPLVQCTDLRYLDIRGNDLSAQDISELQQSLPFCDILWDIELGGSRYSHDITTFTLTQAHSGMYDALALFPQLEYVEAADVPLSEELLSLYELLDGVQVHWEVELEGELPQGDLREYIRSEQIADYPVFKQQLRWLPALERADLCGSGLSNEQMEELCALYPDVRFIWNVQLGPWTLRTDTVDFSTANIKGVADLTDEQIVPLKYCTDLECLDLGHNAITDLTPIAGLTKLRVLIIVCTDVDDISMLSGLTELEFVELYCNKYTDISVISNWKKVKYLNICNNYILDFSPLLECPALEKIWISKNVGADKWRSKLAEHFPSALISPPMATNVTITAYGWRPVDYRALGFKYENPLNSLWDEQA